MVTSNEMNSSEKVKSESIIGSSELVKKEVISDTAIVLVAFTEHTLSVREEEEL